MGEQLQRARPGRAARWRRHVALSLVVASAACTVDPDYRPPDVATPTRFTGRFRPVSDLDRWWTSFGDPTLDDLMNRAVHDNLDVQTAVSRVQEARLQEIVAGAALLPNVGSSAQVTRTELSSHAISLNGLDALAGGKMSSTGTAGSNALAGLGLPGATFNT
jgi:outer membrane protein TolC